MGILSGDRIFGIEQGTYCHRICTCECEQGIFVCQKYIFIYLMELFVGARHFVLRQGSFEE